MTRRRKGISGGRVHYDERGALLAEGKLNLWSATLSLRRSFLSCQGQEALSRVGYGAGWGRDGCKGLRGRVCEAGGVVR